MNEGIILFFAAIVIIGGLLFALMGFTRRGAKYLDQEKYRSKWLAIEQRLSRDNVATYSLCVMNGDQLLDQALKERGFAGKVMAERLKAVSPKLRHREAVWKAHKLRNQIAHESDVKVSYDDARYALAAFKEALKDVGAL